MMRPKLAVGGDWIRGRSRGISGRRLDQGISLANLLDSSAGLDQGEGDQGDRGTWRPSGQLKWLPAQI